jgi:peptide/nickel transport system substrate-binding protein
LWSLRHTFGPQAKEYATSSVSISYSNIIDRIEQTGPDEVSMTFQVPAADFVGYVNPGSAGRNNGVVYPKRATLHNEEAEAAYDSNPIGAGILKLVKHIQTESYSLERFEDHYYQPKNGLPTDKRVQFSLYDLMLVPEEATRVAALRTGQADIGDVSLGARKQVEDGGGRLVFSQEGYGFEALYWGCYGPHPCSDRRVRQALAYALDKELMRDELFGGPDAFELKGWWIVTPSTIGYTPELAPLPFDPDKARQLLAEAGYPGGQGFGKLIVDTADNPRGPFIAESAQLAADFWREELGLDVEVRVSDRQAMQKAKSLTPEVFNGHISWDGQGTRIDASGITRSYWLPYAGRPQARLHHDLELYPLLEQALGVWAAEERGEALNSLYRRLQEEAYVINIGYFNLAFGVGPRIATWQPYPLFEPSASLHTITLK